MFEIIETKGRGAKAGLDKEGNPIAGAEVHDTLMRYRFYPSEAMVRVVDRFYGVAKPDDEQEPYFINYGLYSDSETLRDLLSVVERKSKKQEPITE